MQECPSGVVNEETFKQIYAQFFPHGGESDLEKILPSSLSGEQPFFLQVHASCYLPPPQVQGQLRVRFSSLITRYGEERLIKQYHEVS